MKGSILLQMSHKNYVLKFACTRYKVPLKNKHVDQLRLD